MRSGLRAFWRQHLDTRIMPNVLLRLLLLTMVLPIVAVAGRRIPAAPITATLTPTPQVEITAPGLGFEGDLTWRSGQEYSSWPPPPPSRKLVRGNVNLNTVSIYGHRLLVGSAPPSCLGKCGTCVPCSPVHVSIGSSPGHSGSVTEQEYYPEVWRCKCGNRFFMP